MERFAGIDVAKESLEMFIRPDNIQRSFPNNEKGRTELTRFLAQLRPDLVVLEPSGGYELALVETLALEKLTVVVINPKQVRDFAKAIGKLAKTDTIDAEVIARFGELIRPQIRPLKDTDAKRLQAMVARRRQLVQMVSEEKNRLDTSHPSTKPDIEAHIAWLTTCIDTIEKDIANLIKTTPLWKEKEDLLRTFKGIGPINAVILIARFPELGTLNRKKIAALAGLAPVNRDSGRYRGKRTIFAGRSDVRAALYMATLCAVRHNHVIKSFYNHLLHAGKLPKVALTACMHKVLIILNAMIRTNTPWCAQ